MNKYKIDPIHGSKNKNKGIIPLPLRCLIVGTSECGKTNLLYNLITRDEVYLSIICTFFQNLWNKVYEKVSAKEVEQIAHFFSSCEELILFNNCIPNSLVV